MNTYDGKETFRRTGSSLGRLDETEMVPVAFPKWSDAVVSAVTEIFGISKNELFGSMLGLARLELRFTTNMVIVRPLGSVIFTGADITLGSTGPERLFQKRWVEAS